MATFTELKAATSDPGLLDRIAVAVAIAAQGINAESAATPYHDRRKKWAADALRAPAYHAEQMVWALVAQYKDVPIAQITGATDAQLLAGVTAMLPMVAEG